MACQTWDDNAKIALYESVTDQGIILRKLRTMEEIPAGKDGVVKTKVTETIEGTCQPCVRFIVQIVGTKAHM